MIKYLYNLLFALLIVTNCYPQIKKSVEAYNIQTPLTIDGTLDEESYKHAKPAKDFVQLQPYNGKPSFQPTEAYFFYDQSAIYIGAKMYDIHPDSIFNFLTERDNTGVSDYFGVYLDPYNQGQLAFGFFVTPAGVQIDIKAVKSDGDNEDGNWNAVWESKTLVTNEGWTLEMKIPYSALRFSEKAGNTWGLNMFRNIRRYSSNNSWNFVDRKISGFIHQEGELTGIRNIKPPLRLSLSPYIATYYEPKSTRKGSGILYKGGLDLKYGINDAFTLDMMLVPDFGQIQSDDKKLNLSPYELYYDEKRQFFTEGTELFMRGGIFYSRRIGSSPKFDVTSRLNENEVIDYNPVETQLVNATKISGRTDKGWGIGILNAMSLPANANVIDTLTNISHNVLAQPFTNYNVVVVDKSLKNNSYISLINSNVCMYDNPFHANVTATEFQLRDNTKTYALKGKGGFSIRGDSITDKGFYANLRIEKNKGKLFWGVAENVYSDKFNPNDLGYLKKNNQVMSEAWIYYQIIEPFGIIKECNADWWMNYNRIYNPNTVYDKETGVDLMIRFKNDYRLFADGKIASEQNDYYEPRVKGRFYLNPSKITGNINLITDQRKSLNFAFHYGIISQTTLQHFEHGVDLESTLRLGQRFQINYAVSNINSLKEVGFTDYISSSGSIIFASRHVNTFINQVYSSFIVNNKMSVNLRGRHYWSGVKNAKFYTLESNGTLLDNTFYNNNKDQNYNALTIDLIYRWIFAPGSELSLVWKTASCLEANKVVYNYINNFEKVWLNKSNSISLKVLYYIDYNSLKKKKI